MRIAIVSGTFHPEPGGPPTYLRRLGASLVADGHRVRVATFGERGAPSDYPYPVERVSRCQPMPLRLARLTSLALRDMVGADLVFVSDYGVPALLANLAIRRPLVLKIVSDFAWEFGVRHGLVPPGTTIEAFQRLRLPARLAAVQALQHLYARRADAVVVPSAYLARLVQGWGVDPDRMRVIYNAVDEPPTVDGRSELREVLELPTESPLIATVARLTPWKRIDSLLRAAAGLRRDGCQAHLVVVGDGDQASALVRLARALGLDGAVRFVGAVPQLEVGRYLQAADVFALPSSYEGFSHVLLEAMAAGAAVVATAAGGNTEVVVSGENGLLVPPDDVPALQAALGRVLGDAPLRARLVAEARRTISAYQWPPLYRKTVEVLAEVAAGPERPAK
jgi:glycosyltransferase involved in cell wall biosynthesis